MLSRARRWLSTFLSTAAFFDAAISSNLWILPAVGHNRLYNLKCCRVSYGIAHTCSVTSRAADIRHHIPTVLRKTRRGRHDRPQSHLHSLQERRSDLANILLLLIRSLFDNVCAIMNNLCGSWNYRVFQAVVGKNFVILACTVFEWSTHVTDRRTDRQNCDG